MSETQDPVREETEQSGNAPAEAVNHVTDYELSELAEGEMDLGSVEVMWRLTDEVDMTEVHGESAPAEDLPEPLREETAKVHGKEAETPAEEEPPAREDTLPEEAAEYIEEAEPTLPETLETEETEEAPEDEEVPAAQEAPAAEETPEEEAPAETQNTEEIPVYRRGKPRRRYVYVGTITAAISLIIMGIALTLSLNTPYGLQGAFKASPVILALLGGEILLAVAVNRTARLRFSLKSLITMTLLIGLSFGMSLISATFTATGSERYYAEERLHNIIAREVHDIVPPNISSAEIDMKLYGADTGAYRTSADLGQGDVINISFRFSEVQESVYMFAKDCRAVMDALAGTNYPLGEISFIADDGGERYSLKVDWLYQSGLNEIELLRLTGYYGENITFDIPDIEDNE